jgi:ABC-type branched-subunit amino acid transport system ATPase component
MAVLMGEQRVREVLKIANRVCILRNDRVPFTGPAVDLHDDAKLREVYL